MPKTKHLMRSFALLIMCLALANCFDKKSSGGGGGSGGAAAGVARLTPLTDETSVFKVGDVQVSLCSKELDKAALHSELRRTNFDDDYWGNLFMRRALVFRALYCSQQPVSLEICRLHSGDSDSEDSNEDCKIYNKQQFLTALSAETNNPFEHLDGEEYYSHPFAGIIVFGEIRTVQGKPLSNGYSILPYIDQSILTDSELNELFNPSSKADVDRPTSTFSAGTINESHRTYYREEDIEVQRASLEKRFKKRLQELEDPHWTYNYRRKILLDRRNEDIESYKKRLDTTFLSYLVIHKKYDLLSRFAAAPAVNRWSRSNLLKLSAETDVTTYGLTPLMAAAVLADDNAIKTLKSIPGIDESITSPVLGNSSYVRILDGTYGIGNIGGFQSSHVGGGSGDGSGGGSGSGSGGSGGGGSSGGGAAGAGKVVKKPTVNCPGCTALMVAVKEGNCGQIKPIVADNPAIANQTTSKGVTPIQFSARLSGRCMSELVSAGSQIKRQNTSDLKEITNPLFTLLLEHPQSLSKIPKEQWKSFNAKEKVNITERYFKSYREAGAAILENLFQLGFIDGATYVRWVMGFSRFIMKYEKDKDNAPHLRNVVERVGGLDKISFSDSGRTFYDVVLTQEKVSFYLNKEQTSLNRREVFEYLYKNDPEAVVRWVNGQSLYGYNPLALAVAYNERQLVKLLVSIPGADLNRVDSKSGYSPKMWLVLHSTIFDLGFQGGEGDPSRLNVIPGRLEVYLRRKLGVNIDLTASQRLELKTAQEEALAEVKTEIKALHKSSDSPF